MHTSQKSIKLYAIGFFYISVETFVKVCNERRNSNYDVGYVKKANLPLGLPRVNTKLNLCNFMSTLRN